MAGTSRAWTRRASVREQRPFDPGVSDPRAQESSDPLTQESKCPSSSRVKRSSGGGWLASEAQRQCCAVSMKGVCVCLFPLAQRCLNPEGQSSCGKEVVSVCVRGGLWSTAVFLCVNEAL
eukprot:316326-Rhodomonas_salina.1